MLACVFNVRAGVRIGVCALVCLFLQCMCARLVQFATLGES